MDGAKALLTPEDASNKADWLTSVPAGTTLEQQVAGNPHPASNPGSRSHHKPKFQQRSRTADPERCTFTVSYPCVVVRAAIVLG